MNFYKLGLLTLTSVILLATGTVAFAYPIPFVGTTYATYVSNFQATLNGTLTNVYYDNNYSSAVPTNYVYFQWGTTPSYGYNTPMQPLGYAQSFFQNIADLVPGTTYHYRAVAQGNYGTVYGQDMTFTTTGTLLPVNNNVVYIPTVPTVYGASDVSTGLTNNFLTDSFLLPLLMIVLGLWLYLSGEIDNFANWIKSKI